MKSRSVISVLIITLVAISMATTAYAEPADIVGINAKIYTVNTDQPWAKAIAIDGTDIVYVGDNEGAQAFIGPKTTVGDMQGRFIMRGIISTHEHPLMVMALQSGLILENTGDAQNMLAVVPI